MHKNWLLSGWAYAKIISVRHMHFQSSLFLCPLLPSLSNIQCPLSHVSALSPILCLLNYCTSLFFVFRPLVPVSRLCSLPPVRCPQSSSLFLVSRPLYPVSRLWPSLPSYVFCLIWSVLCLPSSFFVPLPLSTVPVSPFLWLCSTVPVLCSFLSSHLFLRLFCRRIRWLATSWHLWLVAKLW
jgi:hypothetical protein